MLNQKMLGRTKQTRDDWRTPADRFAQWDAIFHFKLDAAASAHDALCRKFLTKKQDALTQHWCRAGGAIFCNPPYAGIASNFAAKAVEESRCPNCPPIVLLLAARLDGWWHEIVIPNAELVVFLKGRVRFVHPAGLEKDSPPFPSALVVISRNHSVADLRRWRRGLETLGWVP